MEPGASAAIVARRHGINGGQVYAWRQQLLLRGAFAAGVDTTSSLVGADVTTTAQRPDVAIAAASESSPPATPIPPMSAQPESRVDTATPDRVSGRVDEDFGAEDAPTTDRTSACGRGADVSNTCRRRRWTAAQKRHIVAESMEPGASAAIVARRHGISSGQVYAWRQQMLLRGAFAAGVDTTSSLVGADVTTTAQRPDVANAPPPDVGPPETPIPPMSEQPESRVDIATPDRVSGRVDEDFVAEDAPTIDRRSVLSNSASARAGRRQTDRADAVALQGRLVCALRRFRQGDRVDRTGWSPVPGEQLLKFVALDAAGDQTFEHVGQICQWIDARQLRCVHQRQCDSPMVRRAVRSREQRVLPFM
jgi:transposase-like protein